MRPVHVLTPDSILEPNPDVLWQELEGEAVLLEPEGGVYFGLDPVGTRVWALLQEPRPLGEIHALLLGEYDVEPDRLWRDLVTLAGELRQAGLVTLA